MKLYTIQPAEVWDQLQIQKIMCADPIKGGCVNLDWPEPHPLEEDHFYIRYQWMYKQMAKRIPGYQDKNAWWAWHTWGHKDGKPQYRPDLRMERCNYSKGSHHVMIELAIPDEKVLLSCFEGWCAGLLNGHFLGWDKEENEAWEKQYFAIRPAGEEGLTLKQVREKLIREGVSNEPYDPYRGLTPDQTALKKLMEAHREMSWERCFNIQFMHNSPYWQGGSVQACFEELRLDQVKKVTPFVGVAKTKE